MEKKILCHMKAVKEVYPLIWDEYHGSSHCFDIHIAIVGPEIFVLIIHIFKGIQVKWVAGQPSTIAQDLKENNLPWVSDVYASGLKCFTECETHH